MNQFNPFGNGLRRRVRGHRTMLRAGAMLVVVAVLGLAACGSDSSSGKTDTGSSASSGGSSSGTTDTGSSASSGGSSSGAGSVLDELLSKDYPLPYPTTPVKVDGDHKVTYISGGIAAGGNDKITNARADILKETGWDVTGPLDGKFSPAAQGTLMQQAILSGTDAIVLDSIYPSQNPEAFKQAREANIPIICNMCEPEEMPEGVTSIAATADSLAEFLVPLVVASVDKPDATIVLVNVEENPSIVDNIDTMKKAFADQCPGCQVDTVNLTFADLGKPAPPVFVNMLNQYPSGKLDAVVGPFSAATTQVITLAEQAGRTDFKVFDTYGNQPESEWIRDGVHTPLLVGGNIVSQTFISYAVVDTLARIFNDMPVEDYGSLPAPPIAKQNAAKYVDADGQWAPEDMESKFKTLWGLSS